jgi:hypothetical protein
MDGLRVPARFGALVQLSIAVLAAFGLAILFAKLRPTARRSAALMCGAFVLLEGYGGPIRSDEIPSAEMRRDVAAYQYLKAQPKGVLLELPAGIFTAELQYVYQTLEHGHQIINGYSGYGTALHELASGPAFREVDSVDGALAMLRTIGVRYVTIHEQLYPDSTLVTALRKEIRTSHDVATTVTVGPVEIIELHSARNLAQLASPLGEAVDMKGVKVTTSQNDGLASRMLDGDLSTRWFTGVPQSGGEVVEITFDRPKQLSHLRLDLQRRSFGDFPRHLIVESSLDGQTFSRLFEGDVLTSLGLSLVERPNEPAIEIPLPRHSGRVLRLRQTGRTPRNWFWSIHELRLWEVANDK